MTSGEKSEPDDFPEYSLAGDSSSEADEIIRQANQNTTERPKPLDSEKDLEEHDPMRRPTTENGLPDSGVNIVNSFVNRTVFFDYFRHVANKRFPELDAKERVQALVQAEPGFYKRSIWSDYVLKIATTLIVVGLATALFVKAIFF